MGETHPSADRGTPRPGEPEAHVAIGYEEQGGAGADDRFPVRFAYQVDWRSHGVLLHYHRPEWLPSVDAPVGDYILNADAGARITVIGNVFADFKVELRYDSTAAPGRDP
jgi:hypothetical protein